MLYFTFGILFIIIGVSFMVYYAMEDFRTQMITGIIGFSFIIAGCFIVCKTDLPKSNIKVEECKRSCEQIDE
jgi:membrane-bound ClpP family serine protease